MTAPDPVAILSRLIAFPSVTPDDAGAFGYVERLLGEAGWRTERVTFTAPGTADVANLVATRGTGGPHLVFSGHVDVVPPGDALPLAAARGDRPGTVTVLLTADEEGPAVNGTAKLLAHALKAGMRFDAAIVGEPTSRAALGDMVKIGRRGSLSMTLRVGGRQGHVAYPHLADNPVPKLVRLVHRLTTLRLDEGSTDFQPSNLEVTSVDVGNPASNVIPAEATARFNVRFNDRWSSDSLLDFLRAELDAVADGAPYDLGIAHRSEWFLTRSDALVAPLAAAIREATGRDPELSTSGGTSDARFFKGVCPVVEFGLVGDTMHQVDERAPVADVEGLARIYGGFLARFFAA